MWKGDELMDKRRRFLRHLYDEGAISDDTCVPVSKVVDVLGAENEKEAERLADLLVQEDLIQRGQWSQQVGYFLTAAGLKEASEIKVRGDRSFVAV